MPKVVREIAWGWLLVWLAFVGYVVAFAPPDDPLFTRALVTGAVTGDFGRIDASIAAVFCALGIIPMLASVFLLRDGATRKLPAWPFALGMFVVGAFALLPWLALRGVGGPRVPARPAGRTRRLLARRTFGAALFLALSALGGWAVARGHASVYAGAFASVSMVHVMTIDLLVCAGLVMVLVEEARRLDLDGEPTAARGARFVPVLGSALWTALTRRTA